MTLYSWNKVSTEQVNPLFARQLVNSATMTVAKLALAKGCLVPVHSHHNEQITMVQSGCLKFHFPNNPAGEQEVLAGPGDVVVIPAHEPHSAEALEDMTGIDLFSPPREDWINGTDSYLRR